MAGSVLAAGALACAAAVTLGLASAGAAAVCGQRAAGAADAAALAAADGASGLVAGVPCELAAAVAEASEGRLVSCDLTGLVATVGVSIPFGAFAAIATARAGPPATASGR
ncbi:MAG: helicase [Actinobacteria bacterium]|nr:helicase [Actinomycetota bacterium]